MDDRTIRELCQRLDFHNQHGLTIDLPHQVEAHQAVVQDLADMKRPDDFWSLMVMATGSGKSFTAGKELKAFNTPVGAKSPVWDHHAIVVTSRVALTNQLKESFVDLAGIDKSKVGIYSTTSKAKSHLEKPVLIVPYPTFLSLSRSKVITPENRPLLILDEAHGAIGESVAKEIKDHWVGKSYVQCWTATDKLPNKTVAQVLFNSKTPRDTDDATYRLTLKQAAERGIVAPIKSMVLETEFTPGVRPTEAGNLSEKDIAKIVNQKGRMQALIRLCHGDYTNKFGVDFSGKRTIIFTPLVQHAEEVAKEFNRIYGPGYTVVVSGETKPQEMDLKNPDGIVSRFTRGNRALGDPRIIINAKYIEEGADIPAAELVVEEVPTFSERVETQRVGRGARKWAGNANKTTYSVVMLDKGQTGAALIGEMEGWELKPSNFSFPTSSARANGELPLPIDYPDIPVHVVADAREIAEFKRRKQEEGVSLERPKPADFWSVEEFGRVIALAKPSVNDAPATAGRIIKSIRDRLVLDPVAHYRDVVVPKAAIAEYDRPSGHAFAIRSREGQAIADALRLDREKPKNFWTGKELGEAILNVHSDAAQDPASLGSRILSAIQSQLQRDGSALYRGVSIGPDAFSVYDYNNQDAFALRKEEGQRIADSYPVKHGKPPGYLNGSELSEAIRAIDPSMSPTLGYVVISKLRQQLTTSRVASYRKIPVSEEAFAEYEYKGRAAYALRKSECDQIVTAFHPDSGRMSRDKPPLGYWTSTQLGEAIKKVRPELNAKALGNRIMIDLRRRLESDELSDYKGMTISRTDLATYEYKSLPAFAVREELGEHIVHTYAALKFSPSPGYLSGSKFSEAIEAAGLGEGGVGSLGNGIINKIRAQLDESGRAEFKGVQITADAIDDYESSGKTSYALRQAEVEAIIDAYKSDSKSRFGIKPKRLKPGEDDLKRTGFTHDR